MNRICIFGGSFDPIHVGHLSLAERIADYSGCKILFTPTFQTPNKNTCADSSHREEMIRLAIADNPRFELCRYETGKKETSYTVYTVQHIMQQYSVAEVSLITGSDTVMDIKNWFNWEQLIKNCRFLCGSRGNSSIAEYLEKNPDIAERVVFYNVPVFECSSTLVRTLIQDKKSIKYLVHRDVEEYIAKKGLYR